LTTTLTRVRGLSRVRRVKPEGRGHTRGIVAHLTLLAAAGAAFALASHLGAALEAPPRLPGARAFGSTAAGGPSHVLLHVLLLLALVMTLARILGAALRAMGQPAVIGEVLAGIVLGPSILGRLSPELAAMVVPPGIAPQLAVLAEVGVILFMFVIGLELDTTLLRQRVRATLAIAHASIAFPFALGCGAALWLYPRYAHADVPFTTFTLFMGVSLSITAFPVLARILKDRGIQHTELGIIALTCAAMNDVSAWCLLAFVVAVARAEAASALTTTVLTFGYVALMLGVVRPLIRRVAEAQHLTASVMPLIFVGVIVSALATELIGIHALFGAFMLGAAIPHDSALAVTLRPRIEDLVLSLFLPAFFALTGIRTEIGLVSTGEHWLVAGLIIVVATVGKLGGSALAARAGGLSWREASAVGALMNTRGLIELVVLNVGLDLGVLSPTLFAMMVIMALVTTAMTSPLLTRLGIPRGTPVPSYLPQRAPPTG
jgi:Kef-type K+ transport system membrane component KefB